MTSYFNTTIGQREQLDRLLDQAGLSHDDVKRILANPTLAVKMVAALNTQPLQYASTSVREQVEQQLTAWRDLGVVISDAQWEYILQQADAFEPATDSDEPLVSGGFGYDNPSSLVKKLSGAFTPPIGYSKLDYIEDAELRYAPGMKPTGGLRLVHYDPNAYPGLSPEAALKAARADKVRLASIEVLEHLVFNPESGLRWDGKLYYSPNLSGLQRKYDTDWSVVPCLDRWVVSYRRFRFDSYWADDADGRWSSPVIREC